MPITVQLRDKTEAEAKAAMDAGDILTAGKRLTDLVTIYKWIPPSDGTNGWAGAGWAGRQAIDYLRECDDPVALARALRLTAGLRFVEGIDHEAFNEESFEISQRVGDEKGIAWCLWQQSNIRKLDSKMGLTDPLEMRKQALAIFERIDDLVGQAVVLQTIAMTMDRNERLEVLTRAAELFRRAGEWDDAARAYVMSQMFGSKTGRQRRRLILQKALNCCRKTGNRGLAKTIYRQIKKISPPGRS